MGEVICLSSHASAPAQIQKADQNEMVKAVSMKLANDVLTMVAERTPAMDMDHAESMIEMMQALHKAVYLVGISRQVGEFK